MHIVEPSTPRRASARTLAISLIIPIIGAFLVYIDNQTTGRWLNVIAMALTALIVTRTVQRLCDGARWPGLIAAAIVVTSHVSLTMHLHLWSEPTFQIFLLIMMALLARQVEAPTRRRAILIALVVAASTMV